MKKAKSFFIGILMIVLVFSNVLGSAEFEPEADSVRIQHTTARAGVIDHEIPLFGNWSQEVDWVNMHIVFNESEIDMYDLKFDNCVDEDPYNYIIKTPPSGGRRIKIWFSESEGTPGEGLPLGQGQLCTIIVRVFQESTDGEHNLSFVPVTRYGATSGDFLEPDTYNATITILNKPPQYQNVQQSKSKINPENFVVLSAQGKDEYGLQEAVLNVNEDGTWYHLDGEWWDPAWKYRKKITIDHTEVLDDFEDFPIRIRCTSIDFYKAQADADDFVFTDMTNSIRYDHEIETFNRKSLNAWVRVPYLSSTDDTELYMYYGNLECESQENPAGVWNDDYLMVHHMIDDTDSTGNGWDADTSGYNFKEINNFTIPRDKSYTITLNLGVEYSGRPIFSSNGSQNPAMDVPNQGDYSGKYLATVTYEDTTTESVASENRTISYDTHVVMRVDTLQHKMSIFVDGILENEVNLTQPLSASTNGLFIGANANKTKFFSGNFDEFHVFNDARSDAWIQTERNNFYRHGFHNIATYGEEEENEHKSGRKYGSPTMIFTLLDTWVWTNFTWSNPTIAQGTVVSWSICYKNKRGKLTTTPEQHFRINLPPHQPTDPRPADGAHIHTINPVLQWIGSDPDPEERLTYDVYFGTTNPPPVVSIAQEESSYQVGALAYSSEYYWRVVIWDDSNRFMQSPVWRFTTRQPRSDLSCEGNLVFETMVAGTAETGSFVVKNIGETGSRLDWEIIETPDWGTWQFFPEHGEDLQADGQEFSVFVVVTAPDEKQSNFTGEIVIENSHNISDFCSVPVTLSTSHQNSHPMFPIFNRIIQRFETFLTPFFQWASTMLQRIQNLICLGGRT